MVDYSIPNALERLANQLRLQNLIEWRKMPFHSIDEINLLDKKIEQLLGYK